MYMNYTTISIKETRDNLAELIERVALTNESFLITKFSKPKALIVPIAQLEKNKKSRTKILGKTFGLWAKKEEIKSSSGWVDDMRRKESLRYGKIFD